MEKKQQRKTPFIVFQTKILAPKVANYIILSRPENRNTSDARLNQRERRYLRRRNAKNLRRKKLKCGGGDRGEFLRTLKTSSSIYTNTIVGKRKLCAHEKVESK